jgi:hypothetical protein
LAGGVNPLIPVGGIILVIVGIKLHERPDLLQIVRTGCLLPFGLGAGSNRRSGRTEPVEALAVGGGRIVDGERAGENCAVG